jgi:sugar lactone lactonase YvrE
MPLRRMLRVLLGGAMLTGLIFSAGPAAAQPRHATRPIVNFAIPGDTVFPEGVASDPRTGFFYVGSSTDGTIYRGRPDRRTMEVFLPGGADGRTAATGMKVDRQGRLYVSGAATGQMWVYDTHSRKLVRHFDTGLRGPNTFINDVTVTPNSVAEIPVAGGPLTNGDGILLAGPVLFVARNANQLIVTVGLDRRLRSGRVLAQFTDPALHTPTTLALSGTRLLVVNSQFDRRGPGLVPDLPFTVSGVPLERVLLGQAG